MKQQTGVKEATSSPARPLDVIVDGKYKMIKKVGSGAFGEIYRATNKETGEDVAVKFEPSKTKFP